MRCKRRGCAAILHPGKDITIATPAASPVRALDTTRLLEITALCPRCGWGGRAYVAAESFLDDAAPAQAAG